MNRLLLFFGFLIIMALCVLLNACGSAAEADPAVEQLAQLDALPAPPGVDPAAWSQLKSALRAAIAGSTRHVSTPPSGSGASGPLSFSEPDSELGWGYYGPGDYDQNGEVNISDLTPLAVHLGEAAGVDGFEPDSIQAVIDGDSNGEINIADVTPIGVNLSRRAQGYHVYSGAPEDYPSAPDDPNGAGAALIATVPLDTGTAPTGRRQFAQAVTPDGNTYWVRTYDGAQDGAASQSVDVGNPNIAPVAALTATPSHGSSPLGVSLDATASSDVDGTVALYEWDFDGAENGESWFSSGADPVALHVYDSDGQYNALVRVTDNKGLTAIAGTAIDVAPTGNLPPVALAVPTPESGGTPFNTLYDASGSSDPDGTIVRYEWDLNNDGNFELDNGAEATQPGWYYEGGSFTVNLRVTDDDGTTATSSAMVDVVDAATWHVDYFDRTNDVMPACALVDRGGRPAVAYYFRTSDEFPEEGHLAYARASTPNATAWDTPVLIPEYSDTATWDLLVTGSRPTLLRYFIDLDAMSEPIDQGFWFDRPFADDAKVWAPKPSPLLIPDESASDPAAVVTEFPSFAKVGVYPAAAVALDQGRVSFAIANDVAGASWSPPVEISAGMGSQPSLADVAGFPGVAYSDVAQGDLLYVGGRDASGAQWYAPEVADSNGVVGRNPMLVDADGLPGIFYADTNLEVLKFIRARDSAGTGWDAPQVLAPQASGVQKALLIDGRPTVLFITRDGVDLKFLSSHDKAGKSWGTTVNVYSNTDPEQGLFVTPYSTGRSIDFELVAGKPAAIFYVNVLSPGSAVADLWFAMYY